MYESVKLNKNTRYILSLLCICISSVQAEDSVTLKTAAYDVQTSIQHDQFKSDFGNKGDAISPIRTRRLVLTKWHAATVITIIFVTNVCANASVLGAKAYWKSLKEYTLAVNLSDTTLLQLKDDLEFRVKITEWILEDKKRGEKIAEWLTSADNDNDDFDTFNVSLRIKALIEKIPNELDTSNPELNVQSQEWMLEDKELKTQIGKWLLANTKLRTQIAEWVTSDKTLTAKIYEFVAQKDLESIERERQILEAKITECRNEMLASEREFIEQERKLQENIVEPHSTTAGRSLPINLSLLQNITWSSGLIFLVWSVAHKKVQLESMFSKIKGDEIYKASFILLVVVPYLLKVSFATVRVLSALGYLFVHHPIASVLTLCTLIGLWFRFDLLLLPRTRTWVERTPTYRHVDVERRHEGRTHAHAHPDPARQERWSSRVDRPPMQRF